MTLLCKQKALYVKCCIIQNNVADYQGDVLKATDIKKIFTSFNNQDSFEIYHNEIPIQEVSLLENYISQTDELIAGTNVPQGSWNAVIRVDNPLIKQKLLNNDFGGVSLNNRVQTACSTGLSGHIRYSDLADAECVIPVYISFVEEGANGVGLQIMDYNVYIQKSKKNGGKNMSLLEDLKALISKAEGEAKEEVDDAETQFEETTEEEEEVVEEEAVEAEATEEEVEENEKPNIKKEATTEEAEDVVEEIVEESVEFDAQAEINALKKEIEELKVIIEELLSKNPIDETAPVVEENPNEPIITKSAKIEVINEPVDAVEDFYARTSRDPITGIKIRQKSKILN